jgi:membrane-anchored protein YejM (alkaline phosphatase superfamily)
LILGAFVAGIPGLLVEDFLKTTNFFGKAAYLANWRQLVSMVRPLERAHHIEEQQFIYQNGTRMLQDRDLNLVLIHFPIPHDAGIWDAGKQAYTTEDSDYLDNLVLADRVLGQIRQTLERNGDWERVAVLISSDHPYRPDAWRKTMFWNAEMAGVTSTQHQPYIRFLLKLPGQRAGVVYDRRFKTVLMAEVLLELLKGRLRSSSEVSAWLDSRADQSLLEPEGPLQPLP